MTHSAVKPDCCFSCRSESAVSVVNLRVVGWSGWERGLFPVFDNMVEQIELQAKLLNYFLGSNKSNINQFGQRMKVPQSMFQVRAHIY